MTEFKADLHCHTLYSDGSSTPEELFEEARKAGLKAISITDHDNLEVYDHFTLPSDLLVGIGVEFSCLYKKEPVHILGYDVDRSHPEIMALCKRHKERRSKRNRSILEKLALMGLPVTEEELKEVAAYAVIGRPHIASVMVKKGYVLSIQEAFNRFLSEGKAAYVQGDSFSIDETIKIIHKANGKAFLAHPHLMISKKRVKEVLEFGLDGIEAYYAKFPLEVQKEWVKLAEERGLLISGGSDYHGQIKPFNTLGSSWVNETIFHQIFQKPLKK